MDPFADPSDVQSIWRPLSDAESIVVASRIMQASRLLRRKVLQSTGTALDDLVTAGPLTSDDVRDVVVEMVYRAMTMPGFVRQESVAVDDGSKSRTFDSSVSGKSGVFVTDDELCDLLGEVASIGEGAFTIVPGDPVWT